MKNVIFLVSFLSLVVACKPSASDEAARLAAANQILEDSIEKVEVIAKQQKTIDSLEVVSSQKTSRTNNTSANRSSGFQAKGGDVEYRNESGPVVEAPAPTERSTPAKKGMSNTTKGAIIGVGAGAVVGAMSSKDKVKGGILGSVIGGSAGAGVGAVIDKKKKKKDQEQRKNENN